MRQAPTICFLGIDEINRLPFKIVWLLKIGLFDEGIVEVVIYLDKTDF